MTIEQISKCRELLGLSQHAVASMTKLPRWKFQLAESKHTELDEDELINVSMLLDKLRKDQIKKLQAIQL